MSNVVYGCVETNAEIAIRPPMESNNLKFCNVLNAAEPGFEGMQPVLTQVIVSELFRRNDPLKI